ncbi:MAG TPA: benzoylformate decarboxylase [Alphaproteobacteria bacterium]|nr:benzoylformate decarboxylase [Alphaproteobacteria bacterium]
MSAPHTVRSVTFDFLRAHGMTTVFGNPGSTELAFLQGWPADFRYVLGLQEATVVGMADGYAQAAGACAFVNLHSAAGVGNALGAVFTAYRNQTPLLITAGQQARSLLPWRPFLGATAAAEFPKPYVKWSCEPARARDVPVALAQAYHIALQKPCGPTFVSVPSDDWTSEADPVLPQAKSRRLLPDPEPLRALAAALERSQRPAIVVGTGVERDGAYDRLIEFAEKIRAAVWAAPMNSRRTFPEDHALFAGFLPSSPEQVSDVLRRFDLVLVLGAPVFTYHVPGEFTFTGSGIPLFQITDDAEAAAATPLGTSILATADAALEALIPLVSAGQRAMPAPLTRGARIEPADPILAELVMQTIADLRGPASIILEEAPSHRDALQRMLPMRRGDQYYAMASGGLGFALPASVGVALARPGQRVVCIIGDGSAMYSIQALWTAAQHKLPLTVVVLNNGGYGAMRAFSRRFNIGALPGIDIAGLDFAALAKAQGCAGMRVERAAELRPALQKSLAADGPALVEVAVSQEVVARLN